jgi:hypothetical protein
MPADAIRTAVCKIFKNLQNDFQCGRSQMPVPSILTDYLCGLLFGRRLKITDIMGSCSLQDLWALADSLLFYQL